MSSLLESLYARHTGVGNPAWASDDGGGKGRGRSRLPPVDSMISHVRGILTEPDLKRARELLQQGTFEAGRLTASGQAAKVKDNLQLARRAPAYRDLDAIVQQGLGRSEAFANVAFPNRFAPFTYNRYDVGMTYGAHVDAPFPADGRMRSDIAMTLFLSDPASYDGGELVIEDGGAETRAKYAAGDAVVYPATSLHHVARVTRGSRIAMITWIQSFVPDPRHRQVLGGMLETKLFLERTLPDAPETNAFRNALYNLIRLWWQP